jgi:hypothetical protein
MAHDAFISYSSKDKAVADAVVAALEARGVHCWVAPRDILAGMHWGAAIVHAIAQSRVLVLVYSSNANASSHIQREVERAADRNVPIVPFRIEDVRPSAELEYFLGTPHWLDAVGAGLHPGVQRLAEVVVQVVGGARRVTTPANLVPPAESASTTEVHVGWVPAADRDIHPVGRRARHARTLGALLGAAALVVVSAIWYSGFGASRLKSDNSIWTAQADGLVSANAFAPVTGASEPADGGRAGELPPPAPGRAESPLESNALGVLASLPTTDAAPAVVTELDRTDARAVAQAVIEARRGRGENWLPAPLKSNGRREANERTSKSPVHKRRPQPLPRGVAADVPDGRVRDVRYQSLAHPGGEKWRAYAAYAPAGLGRIAVVTLVWEDSGWQYVELSNLDAKAYTALQGISPTLDQLGGAPGAR